MRSLEFRWLLVKDLRELAVSKAWWLLLLLLGLLVGHGFLSAVETYAEMSGGGHAAAALSQGLSPLDGIVVPTLGMIALAATLLLPFLVIRVVAHERRNGAWKLLVQGPAPVSTLLLSKVIILLSAWAIAWTPAVLALALWAVSGNHLNPAETGSVFLGHMLFAWLAVGIAAAAAAGTDSEASAAIVALAITIGTWAIDFVGEAQGGLAAEMAEYTPTSVLRSFEHGLVRLDATIILLMLGALGLVLAAIWLNVGQRKATTRLQLVTSVGVAALAIVGCSRLRTSWDVSEDRRNSFPAADERALRQIRTPLQIEIHLAPEDPRLVDLESNVLAKLRRTMPSVDMRYLAHSRTGLFEQPGQDYGEVWYQLGDKRAMSRSATPEIVLSLLYELAGITAPAASASGYPGYPLVAAPSGIAWYFFVGWPLVVLIAFLQFGGFARARRRRAVI